MSATLDLFDARKANGRDIERLIPLALRLATQAGTAGITVGDLRGEAVRGGFLTGEEVGRRLSYLGAVMKAAGLRPTEMYRRSAIEKSHGNLHRVWAR